MQEAKNTILSYMNMYVTCGTCVFNRGDPPWVWSQHIHVGIFSPHPSHKMNTIVAYCPLTSLTTKTFHGQHRMQPKSENEDKFVQ